MSVLLVTKARIDEGSTKWAQGGIAAALGPGDTPDQHKKDTLAAGAGLCDTKAVDVLVSEGPEAVRKLIAQGAVFDKSETGEIALTREGGHLRNRILHAGGDATGAEVSRALLAAVRDDDGIEIIEHALAIDALKSPAGRVCGVTLHVIGAGSRDGVGRALARAVVVATGGLGQVYSQTTNPAVSTGDGVALALRAGAKVADVEFVQFHPTVLWRDLANRGQQPLISEAVRGEGAILLNNKNEQFMVGKHPQADLAPVDGLYICGESACTGAHGANRLASNSLLEGLVFGARIAAALSIDLPAQQQPVEDGKSILLDPKILLPLQIAMSEGAGVLRSEASLTKTLQTLEELSKLTSKDPRIEAWEATNLHLLATVIVKSALLRTESRGSHWRSDYPQTQSNWTSRIIQQIDSEGNWQSKVEVI